MAKKIGIIGAGCSGLVAIKSCLDEGLEPVCLEKTSEIGGLWNYTTEVKEDEACVMKATVINTSKEMMAYSDFPIPAHYANYMHNKKVWKYFDMYADKFGLKDYIRFSTEVLELRQADDFENNGQWVAEVKDITSGNVTIETYDGILICSGHHTKKKIPSFEGLEEFQGRVVHTHDYKDHRGLEDKRIIVIGIGNSGADTVVETSRVGQQVFLSTKRGAWVLHRVTPRGLPFDVELTTRWNQDFLGALPRAVRNWLLEKETEKQFNHKLLGMRPAHRWDACHPLVCDELANRISCGSIIVKPNIRRFTKTGVEFEDGTFEDNIDVVVTATGYLFGFPYIKHPAFDIKNNRVNLFKYVFPPDIKPATLAVIGCIQPIGAIMPISELQCRWATRVFKGVTYLPDARYMWEDVRSKQAVMAHRYVDSTRHTIQVDWIDFMDQIAEQIGCKPDLRQLAVSDPWLAKEVLFGPCTPYQYRLHGPGAWTGARDAIMTQWDRIYAPYNTRQIPTEEGFLKTVKQIVILLLVVYILRWLFI